MFITGLNRFFERHGRKTFAVFTGIIIISFVLYFSPGFDITHLFGTRKAAPESLPGGVSKDDFQNAINSNMILISMQLGGAPLKDQFVQQMAYYKALDWASAVKIAEERGFSADDKAVFERITSMQSFKGKDGFDKTSYDLFLKNTLGPFGFNSIHLEDAVRKDIALARMNDAIRNSAISSDAESDFEFDAMNSRIKARIFTFKDEDFIAAAADKKDVEAYFNANRAKYMTPSKSRAMAVRFNYIEFEGQASKLLTDKDIESYYESNKDKFTKDGKPQPLESAKAEIKERLLKDKCSELAIRKAQDFSLSVYQISMDMQDKSLKEVLQAKAKEAGLPAAETDFFDEKSKAIKNVGAEPDFAHAVSELIMDQPLSDPIKGSRAAFVALLLERQEPRQAEFAEAENDATKDYLMAQAAKIASQKASEAALSLTEKLAGGARIADIAEAKGANCVELPEFSLVKPPESPYSSAIIELALHTRPGRLSEVRNAGDAKVFILVEAKSPPEKKDPAEMSRSKSQYKTRKQNLAWFNFLNSTQKPKTSATKD